MKPLIVLACLLLSFQPDPSLLVLDKDLRKPVHESAGFSTAQYQQHCFPVYAAEREVIIEATDKLVRLMERGPGCFQADTVTAGHTMFLLREDCEIIPSFSVLMITTIEESQTSFGFTLVKEEVNRRRAQQKLLDFATYLAR